MGGKIFEDIQYKGDDLKKDLDEGSTYMKLFWEAATTFGWLVVATAAGGSSWAWALSYVVLMITFHGSKMNSLCFFKDMINGKTSVVHFALNMFAHVLGAIAAYTMASQIGFAAPVAPAHGMSFSGFDWKMFFFGREFWGIFLYIIFKEKANNQSGIPEKLWNMMILAVAFMIGGANFVFVPARMFTSFASFADAGLWCCFLSQVWAVVAACVVNQHVWVKRH